MPKEKSINPAQAARKAEKAKAIKKGKASLQAQKSERLAKKNPFHLQKQLDDLKAVESSGGKLTGHERSLIDGLEKEIKAIKKAKDELGIKDEPRSDRGDRGGRGGFGSARGGGVLGKRRRDAGSEEESSGEEVGDDVKRIPMPRDTPPPIPKEILDVWYAKRRARRANANMNANEMPLGGKDRGEFGAKEREKEREKVEVKTVYEAKPIIRDLRKEAVAFVPAAVRAKIQRGKGESGLMEEEEAQRLEKEGYVKGIGGDGDRHGDALRSEMNVQMEEVEDEDT